MARVVDTESYINTRARLQSHRSGAFLSAWIVDLNNTHVHIRLNGPRGATVGEQFHIEAYGPQSRLLFPAQVVDKYGGDLSLLIKEPVRVLNATESPRYVLEGTTATIVQGDHQAEVEVLDLSPTGAALLAEMEYERGEQFTLYIKAKKAEVLASAEVVYCRPSLRGHDKRRVGVKIEVTGRVERARWLKLFGLS